MKATVSRRDVLATISAGAMTPNTVLANGPHADVLAHAPHVATDDPAFVAIERHRLAMLVAEPARRNILTQLSRAEQDAFLAWLPTPPTTMTFDPVFAAIENHLQAVRAWQASMGGGTREDDKITQQLLDVERDAWRTWLTTQPTTMVGVIATLEHASRRPYPLDPDCPDDHIYANLMEAGEYLDDTREIGEQFPQMIAEALRKISSS